jgi:hypothetical protein
MAKEEWPQAGVTERYHIVRGQRFFRGLSARNLSVVCHRILFYWLGLAPEGKGARTPERCGDPAGHQAHGAGGDRAADKFHFWNQSERNAFISKKKRNQRRLRYRKAISNCRTMITPSHQAIQSRSALENDQGSPLDPASPVRDKLLCSPRPVSKPNERSDPRAAARNIGIAFRESKGQMKAWLKHQKRQKEHPARHS